MNKEDKDLLLKDICARLPYGVVIQEKCLEHDETFLPYAEDNKVVNIDVHEDLVITSRGSRYYIEDIKPYLFPLSSMTEEQKEEFYKFFEEGITESANETRQWLRTKKADETRRPITIAYVMVHELVIDWLNKNHFDYRGLIEKGLAIDATNLNIY